MRNVAIIVSALLLMLVSCTGGETFYSIRGTGVASGDTLYLYGLDQRYDYMDTILADDNGTFGYEIYADTVFPLNLLLPTGETLLLYAEPSVEAVVAPDSARQDRWNVSGGVFQHLYDSMVARLEKLPADLHFEVIDSFVRRDPMNEVNIMLWRRYMIESPTPNIRKIREISNLFGGKLSDDDYIVDIQEFINQKRSLVNIMYTSVPVFNLLIMDDSTRISNSRYKGKFLVLNFWASWDSLSCERVKQMSRLSSRYTADELALLNVSLDHDTAQWHHRVHADSILGDNVCDLQMWDNALAKKYDVNKLPYSVLINPQQLNIGYNTTPEELETSLDSIMDAYKKEKKEKEKKEKEKKEKEKRRKKRK